MKRGLLCDAIRDRRIVLITYDGSVRKVEPHLLGYSTKGNLTLSAWQLSGGTSTGWKDFVCAKIINVVSSNEVFAGPRPDFNPRDRTMREIICRL